MRTTEAANWQRSHPQEVEWLMQNRKEPGFINSVYESLQTYGTLTNRQLHAVQARMSGVKPAASNAISVAGQGFDKLLTAFSTAKAAGIKRPGMRIGHLKITLAPDTGSNPGMLYVKSGTIYLGKITRTGGFFPSRDCMPQQSAQVAQVGSDPLAEAIAHGKRTGVCACCGRELENEESVALGIGPICRQKWGM